jgi:spore germination protein YaaH
VTVVRDLALAILLSLVAAVPVVLAAVRDEGTPEAEPAAAAPCLFAFLSNVEGDRELESLRRADGRVSVVAPNWYAVDRRLRVLGGPPRSDVRRLADRLGVPVWPVVNARLGFARVFTSGGRRRSAARALARLAARERFDGITLDLEEVRPADRRAFGAFVRELARRLHRGGRRLAVYVPRRTAVGATRSTAAYDHRSLARSADLVLASGYNEHSAGGQPGPITTARGFRQVVRYAAGISRSRIVPVLGAFGYSWPAGGGRAELIGSHDAEARRRGGRRSGGAVTYVRDGARVWYESSAGLASRVRAARRERMRWVGLFSLGREPARALPRMRVSGRCRGWARAG